MKRFFPITLSIALTLQVSAQEMKLATRAELNSMQNQKRPTETIEYNHPPSKKIDKGSSTLSSANVVDKLFNAFSYLGKTVPLVFEPKSNMYVKVQRGADEATRGNLYISGSKDNGKTWSENVLVYDPIDSDNDQARYPSLQVSNPTGSNNIEEFDYTVITPVLRTTTKVKEFFNGFNIVFKKGSSAPSIFPFSEPENNNKDLMTWGISASLASDESKSSVYLAQMLNTRNIIDTSRVRGQYGTYGFMSANTALQEATGTLPEKWAISQFPFINEDGPISKESSYNTNPLLGTDNEGTLYSAVINFWIPDLIIEDQRRLVGISKSTDQGETWSDFEKMPYNVLINYLVSNNADTAIRGASGLFGSTAYHSHGFVVTGKDEFSYVYPFVMTIDGERKTVINHAYKKDGVWGIKTVAEYSGSTPIFQQMTNGVLTPDTSSRGNEIQLARTLDGKHLVAKWIDYVPYTFEDQEVNVTDIFVSVFDMETQTWSEKKNVTNDNQFDKLTWLPQTLPSINEIPVLSIVNDSENEIGTIAYLEDQLRLDFICSVVSTVFHPLPVSVQEQPIVAQSSLSITPNPAQDAAEIGFSLAKPSFTTVSLINALGENVKTLYKGHLESGFRGFNASLEGISAGTYYVSITTSNGSISSPVVIVR